jgi:hypothetical protein
MSEQAPSKEQFADLVSDLEHAAEVYGRSGGQSAKHDVREARAALLAACSSGEPPAGLQSISLRPDLPSVELVYRFDSLEHAQAARSTQPLASEPGALNVAPIASITVKDGDPVGTCIYAPGLPDGEHELFPVPLNPSGRFEPFLGASQPPPAEIASDIGLVRWFLSCCTNYEKAFERILLALRAAPPPVPEYFDIKRANELGDAIVQRVCEIPDRTSPDDEPDALICSPSELHNCVVASLECEFEHRTSRSCLEQPTSTKPPALPRMIWDPCSKGGLWKCDLCDESYCSPPWSRDNAAKDHAGKCPRLGE